jgi:hypothetical protein
MQNESHTREATEFNGKRILVTGGTKGIGKTRRTGEMISACVPTREWASQL